jgi:hypothetical protein
VERSKRVKKAPRKPESPEGNELEISKISGGYNDPELSAEIKERFGIPNTFLTEKQWAKIGPLLGLPVQARFEINIALKRYWYSYREESISPETLPELARVRDLLEKSVFGLADLAKNADLFKGQIVHFDKSAIEQRRELRKYAQSNGIVVERPNSSS